MGRAKDPTRTATSVLGQPASRSLQLDNSLDRGILDRLIARQLGHVIASQPVGAYKIDHRAWHVTVPDPYREHFGVNADACSRLLTSGAIECRPSCMFVLIRRRA